MATPTSPDPYAKYADPYSKYVEPTRTASVPVEEEPNFIQSAARSGAAKFLAPMVGGFVGGRVGNLAGGAAGLLGGPAAPVTVPAGVVAGGAAGSGVGTAGAEAIRQKLAGEEMNPDEIRKQGIIAAATDPLGMGLGPGIAAVRGLRGSVAVGNAGKRFLAGFSKEIEERFPGAGEVVEQIGVGQKGIRQADKMLNQVTGQHRQLVQAASAAGAKAMPLDLMTNVMDVISKLDEAGSVAAEAVRSRANKFFDALGPSGTFQLNANRILKIKQAAQDAADRLYESQGMRRSAGKVIKRVGGKTAEMNFQEALAKGAQQWLETNVPGSAELNLTTRSLLGAKRVLSSPASRTARRGTARFITAATAAALPGGIFPRMGAAAIGYGAGHVMEPAITPMLGAGLGALQSPIGQQAIRQIPRGLGLGFNQGMQE